MTAAELALPRLPLSAQSFWRRHASNVPADQSHVLRAAALRFAELEQLRADIRDDPRLQRRREGAQLQRIEWEIRGLATELGIEL